MEVKIMPKIQESINGKFVYLPKAFTTLLEWNKGDTLAIYPSNTEKGTLIMRKVIDAKDIAKKTPATQTQERPQQQPTARPNYILPLPPQRLQQPQPLIKQPLRNYL